MTWSMMHKGRAVGGRRDNIVAVYRFPQDTSS